MDKKVKDMREVVANHLWEIQQQFIRSAKVTVIIRQPELQNADVIMGDDDPLKVIEAINKMLVNPKALAFPPDVINETK